MDVDALRQSPIGRLVPILVPEIGSTEPTIPYWAYVPSPLGHNFDLSMSTLNLATKAGMAIARLDQAVAHLPNPGLLVRPIIRKEAASTSALEGTFAEFDDVLESDFLEDRLLTKEQREIRNVVRATELAMGRIKELPIARRLIGELQSVIVTGTIDETYDSGDLRQRQVYIGPKNRPVQEARFIPPPSGVLLEEGFDNWEKWINSKNDIPIVIKMALGHYQFETLHPYANGNGRLGRLIGLLQLVEEGSLSHPILNLSAWFEVRRAEYVDGLLRVTRTGDFDTWIRFYAEGVLAQAVKGVATIDALERFKEQTLSYLRTSKVRGSAITIAESLIGYPIMNVAIARSITGLTFEAANQAVAKLVEKGILEEITGRRVNRLFVCKPVLEIVRNS
jgi:cell filamentation protein, protein adenylyltransferase